MDSENIKIPVTGKAVWNESMKYGAILGIITVALEFIPSLWTPSAESVLSGGSIGGAMTAALITFIFSLVKMGICIWLMVLFSRKLAKAYDDITSKEVFKFGMFMALLSGIIVSAANLLKLKLINPEIMENAIRMASESSAAQVPEGFMDSMMSLMPVMTVLTTFIKCFLIGLIAALIISKYIPGKSNNPFAQN